MQTPEGARRRAERSYIAYVAKVGRVSPFAPPIPAQSEWVRRALAAELPVKRFR